MVSPAQRGDVSHTVVRAGEQVSVLDLAVGASLAVAGAAGAVGRTAGAVGRRAGVVARPVVGVVLRPPLLSARYQPITWMSGLARRGGEEREALTRRVSSLLDLLLPRVVAELLGRIDVAEAITRYVDLDSVVSAVDLDAVAARLDVDAVAQRLDLDAVIARLDLTRIVLEQVQLDRVVAAVDVDAVAGRLDVDAVAGRLDLDTVIDRIDLVALATDVMAALDLPEIIRESTGSVASETVRGVRMQGISGDEAIGRAVDRLRLRRGRRSVTPVAPLDSALAEEPTRPEAPSEPTRAP